MKKLFVLICLMLVGNMIMGQNPNVRNVEMSELLPYVLPFYLVTMISLGLFLQKIIKPAFPTKWLYLSTIIGILGAIIMAYQFKDFRVNQLTDTSIERKLDEMTVAREEKQDQNEVLGDFWRIAIPNVILLSIGLGLDYRNRQIENEKSHSNK